MRALPVAMLQQSPADFAREIWGIMTPLTLAAAPLPCSPSVASISKNANHAYVSRTVQDRPLQMLSWGVDGKNDKSNATEPRRLGFMEETV
jgi:hypothetical protein